MLTELSIQNFAIIDEIAISFREGLTVLTGETGAGKSIIIDALQLLAGGRGSAEYVRHGARKAEIEGLFVIEKKNHPIYDAGRSYGIEIEDEQIVLERVITESGKSICRVNGKLVTLGILREFGKTLIDIHSQHETQSLMNSEHHIDLLDLFDEKNIAEAKAEYIYLYDRLANLEKRYDQLTKNEKEMAHRLDLLEFQYNEIQQAELEPDEDEKLEKERSYLANYERIYTAVQDAYNALYGERRGIDWLHMAQQALQDASAFDETVHKKEEELANYYYLLQELTFELRNYSETLAYDPARLNEIEARLDEINHLKKKYGNSVNEILEYLAEIEEEIEQIKNKDIHLTTLANKIEELKKDVYLEAKELHDIRKNAALLLTEKVKQELKGLYMENADFAIAFQPKIDENDPLYFEKNPIPLHKNGMDRIEFMISTNPGEPLKELAKVASGGEMSRIMLALKTIFARHQDVTSVIFDEVDTGVSGRVAQAIAEKIHEISKQSQVLCITHLPQVASMADTHKRIEKHEKNNRTVTTVSELSELEQIDELGRMITGTELTETAKEHAKELLQSAASYKSKAI